MFARMLQVNFGWVIYSNCDHCVLKKAGLYYDIEWIVPNPEWYLPIDKSEEERYKRYENFII